MGCIKMAKIAIDEWKYSRLKKDLLTIKGTLQYYLDINEEKGVVYIPKFVIEKLIDVKI